MSFRQRSRVIVRIVPLRLGLAAVVLHLSTVAGCRSADRLRESQFQYTATPVQVFEGKDDKLLRSIVAVREGAGGEVYALDNAFKHVVVFGQNGAIRRVIGAGYGNGPGEFIQPRDVAVDESSNTYVIDQELRKVARFDSLGALRREFQVEEMSPVSIEVLEGNLWVIMIPKHATKGDRFALVVYDTSGRRVGQRLLLKPRDVDFAYADPGAMAATSGGHLLFAHGAPGIWTVVNGSEETLRGKEAFPDADPHVERRGRNYRIDLPCGTLGVGQPTADRVLIYYFFERRLAGGTGRDWVRAIDVFGGKGAYLGTFADEKLLMNHSTKTFTTSKRGLSFYLAQDRPKARIVQYRLMEQNAVRTK